MKIATTYKENELFQHFGKSDHFKIYETQDKTILSSQVVPVEREGHGGFAAFLKENGVEALICGGIGQGAKDALTDAGIQIYAGAQGDCDTQVTALLNGTLVYGAETKCNHHDHDHEHEHKHEHGHQH